nr:uncharacterized protein LOC112545340 [Pelodiscus sinensis]|eukprot:XP_025039017.1 uncharacterized protein LOC112545340 [Pelodiscus sinensis]
MMTMILQQHRDTNSDWWDQIIMEHWDDQQWLQNFHMWKDTFMELCEWLTSALTQWDTHMQPAIPLQEQITIAIWKLTMLDSYCSIGNQFSVGRSTVGVVVVQVVRAINTTVLRRVIILGKVDPIVAGFAPIGFPNCWGGTLTALISPSGLPTTGHRTTLTSSTFPWSCRPSWTSGSGSPTLTSGGRGRCMTPTSLGTPACSERCMLALFSPTAPSSWGHGHADVHHRKRSLPLVPLTNKAYTGHLDPTKEHFNTRLSSTCIL